MSSRFRRARTLRRRMRSVHHWFHLHRAFSHPPGRLVHSGQRWSPRTIRERLWNWPVLSKSGAELLSSRVKRSPERVWLLPLERGLRRGRRHTRRALRQWVIWFANEARRRRTRRRRGQALQRNIVEADEGDCLGRPYQVLVCRARAHAPPHGDHSRDSRALLCELATAK